MFLMALGILDIIAGGILAFSGSVVFAGNTFVLFFAILFLLKGIYSVGAAAGAGFYLDVLGWFDLIACLLLFLSYSGLAFSFYLYMGIIMVVKGIYSFAIGAIRS